jgi:hypothetical protein
MRKPTFVFSATVALAFSLWTGGGLMAQQSTQTPNSPMSGNTKPDSGKPAMEKSLPSSAPAATISRNTAATDQNKTVKSMNNQGKANVEAEGK